jgi:hypothetical protein
MPRTIEEILDHADELAKRFEDYEPVDSDQIPVAEHLLRRAALKQNDKPSTPSKLHSQLHCDDD